MRQRPAPADTARAAPARAGRLTAPALCVLAAAVVASACGTRVEHDEVVAAAGGTAAIGVGLPGGDGGGPRQEGPGVSPGDGEGQAATATTVRRPTDGASDAAPADGGGPRTGATTPPGPAQGGPAAPKSTVVIATVGTLSGPAGAVLRSSVAGAQLWVKHINDNGGLNGHPVRHIVYDDGADPARHSAHVKNAVEEQQVLAFLNNVDPLTGEGDVAYITEKRVPVVGIGNGIPWAYASPMIFPHTANADAGLVPPLVAMASVVRPGGKTRLGTVTCREAQGCRDADRVMSAQASGLGFQHVYRAEASIAQPDFTAECLAAKQAGVEVLMVVLDSNSLSRMAAGCARQAFRPRYGATASVVVDRFKDDPNLVGLVASSQVFPYFRRGTPATDEYQQALAKYGGGMESGVGPAHGWTAGKLLERAARDLPDNPTRDDLLRGLWSIRGDDLGGLTLPLTFNENQPANHPACWFTVNLPEPGSWSSPNDFRLDCD